MCWKTKFQNFLVFKKIGLIDVKSLNICWLKWRVLGLIVRLDRFINRAKIYLTFYWYNLTSFNGIELEHLTAEIVSMRKSHNFEPFNNLSFDFKGKNLIFVSFSSVFSVCLLLTPFIWILIHTKLWALIQKNNLYIRFLLRTYIVLCNRCRVPRLHAKA